MAQDYPVFAARAETFLHPENPEVERLKAIVDAAPERDHVVQFRKEFREILDKDTLSRRDFRHICYQDFDTDEEYRAWLQALWDHLFEDGPQPPV